MSDFVVGLTVGIVCLYLVQVLVNYAKLRRVDRKRKEWCLVDGAFYMISNRNGFWYRACFIDSNSVYVKPFFKLSESSFKVDLFDVADVKPDDKKTAPRQQ